MRLVHSPHIRVLPQECGGLRVAGSEAKACSRFGQERSDVPRGGEGAWGAPESKGKSKVSLMGVVLRGSFTFLARAV